MQKQDDYVVRLMKAKCSMGTMSNYLNVKYDHGIITGAEGQPLMNANDHISGENVIHFGKCQSNTNPKNVTTDIIGSFCPIVKLIDMVGEKMGCSGCTCSPATFVPWINCNDEHIVEGAPVLTTKSKLACLYGGIISIEEPEEVAAATAVVTKK